MRDRYNEKPHDAALPDPWPGRLDVLDVEACIKTNRGLPMSTKEGRQQVQMKEGGEEEVMLLGERGQHPAAAAGQGLGQNDPQVQKSGIRCGLGSGMKDLRG